MNFPGQTRKLIFLAVIVVHVATALRFGYTDEAKEKPMFTETGHTVDELNLVKSRVEKKQAVLLDIREEDEWEEGHLQAARLVPLSRVKDGEIPEDLLKLFPKDRPIYLHCRSGGRVLKCASVLKAKGYDLRPLKAGFEQLAEFGFATAEPVQKP